MGPHTAVTVMSSAHDVSLRRYFINHFEGIDLDALGDALQRITAAADHLTGNPARTACVQPYVGGAITTDPPN